MIYKLNKYDFFVSVPSYYRKKLLYIIPWKKKYMKCCLLGKNKTCILSKNCPLGGCGNKEIFMSIKNPLARVKELCIDSFYTPDISFKDLHDMIKNTAVFDANLHDEKEKLLYFISELLVCHNDCINDGRLIISKEFAVMLYNFLLSLNFDNKKQREQLNKFKSFAKSLLSFQIETAQDSDEITYINNVKNNIQLCEKN